MFDGCGHILKFKSLFLLNFGNLFFGFSFFLEYFLFTLLLLNLFLIVSLTFNTIQILMLIITQLKSASLLQILGNMQQNLLLLIQGFFGVKFRLFNFLLWLFDFLLFGTSFDNEFGAIGDPLARIAIRVFFC